MALRTLEELQRDHDALTARIVALDIDIMRETDNERRLVLKAKRDDLAREREILIAEIAVMHPSYPLAVVANAPILEHRVTTLEKEVKTVHSVLRSLTSPGPRQIVSRATFYGLLVILWSMWMIKEIRDWLFLHPAQAIAISLSIFIAALIIRWLPEEGHNDDQR